MSKSIELREQMAQLATQARAKYDELNDKTSEGRSKEIEAEFDALMADHDKIGEALARSEKLEAAEERAKQNLLSGDPRAPKYEGMSDDAKEERASEYVDVFAKAIREGAASLNAEERGVLMANRAEMSPEMRAQSTGTDAAGGYTVPTEFSGSIDKAMAAWGPMWDANIVTELNTSNGRQLDWPTVDDTAKTGRIKAQNAAVDDDGSDDVVFGNKQLDAYVYDTGMVRMPLELLTDSAFAMEPLLNDLFGERLGRLANTVLTTGTGTGQPNGIATAATSGLTAAGATAITSDEILDLIHSVDPAYRQNPKCRFMFNDSTLNAIRKLKDGQGNYLWQMGDVRSGEPNTIFGYGYSINQAVAGIATGNRSVLFGDMSKYIVRKVNGFQVMTLRERYAENFQVGMVGFKRFDGELLNAAAVKCITQA